MPPTAQEFQKELDRIFATAQQDRKPYVEK